MTRYRLLKFVLLGVILLISWGCSSTTSDPGDGSLPPGFDPEAEPTLPDYPLISRIEAEPRVVSPGEQVTFTGVEGIAGTLNFTTPAGDSISTEITAASGAISLDGDAPEGIYTGLLETEAGAVAFSSFRVAIEPGVWLTADRRYVSPGAVTTLSVESMGLETDALAAVYVLAEQDVGGVPLVPDDSGRLVPGIPIALSDLVGRPLQLDDSFLGAVQVQVEQEGSASLSETALADAVATGEVNLEAFEGWISNTVQLAACNQPGAISGDIGGGGFVNAVWMDGNLRSASTFTANGSFTLAAGPGTVLVQAFRVDQDPIPEPETQMVSLACGGTAELASLGAGKVAAQASIVKAASPRSIGAQVPSDSQRPSPAAQAGGGEVCRTGIVAPIVRDSDGINERQSTLAGIALKTALNEAASQAEVSSLSDVRALIDAAAEAMSQNPEDEDEWNIFLEAAQSMVASDFVISLSAARIGQRYGVNAVALPMLPGDAQVRASGQGSGGALFDPTFSAYSELAEKFRQAAICGSAEPESAQIGLDEEVTIRYKLTDLSGEGADGASVTISPPECGRLDPDNGSIEGEQFETKFSYHTEEYCAEELDFEAEWSGSEGSVKTRPEEAIVRITPELPELTLRAGAAPGIGNTANMATAITLYDDYDVDDDPASLPGFTQESECKFLEGGQVLGNEYFYAHSESVGKRAESTVVIHNYVVEQGEIEDLPINAIEMLSQLTTRAVEIEDDNIIRGSWASGANHSDPNLTRTPGTLLVYDIYNPGNLPTTPILSWQLRGSIDDASGYTVLVIYKVIKCGEDPGIGSLLSFATDASILLESDNESPGPPTGQVPLPEFDGDRQQIIMWVVNVLTTASIRDDWSDANIGGGARMRFKLDLNLSQTRGEQ